MKKFTYFVEGIGGGEISVEAETPKEAHKKAWESLTDEQRDACIGLDWIDTEEVAQS